MATSTFLTGGDAKSGLAITAVGVIAFVCGATSILTTNIVGTLYLSEVLLIPLGIAVLVLGDGKRVGKSRLFWAFVATGALSLVGYMISDLLAGTAPAQYLRGWARVGLVVSDAVWLTVLAASRRQNIWWFALGAGIGGVAYLAIHHLPLHDWKGGYGDPLGGYARQVVLIVFALTPLISKRFTPLFLMAFGVLNVAVDFRSLGGICVVAAVLLWARSGSTRRLGTTLLSWRRLVVIGTFAVVALLAALVHTASSDYERRAASDVGRAAGIIVALRAIADSPFIGYGSWTINEKYAREITKYQKSKGEKTRGAYEDATAFFLPHSQVLQAWVEGGILGAGFFLLYLFQLIKSATWMTLKGSMDAGTPLYLYLLGLGIWSAVASPFAGYHRLSIGMAIAVIVSLGFEKGAKAARSIFTTNEAVHNHAVASRPSSGIRVSERPGILAAKRR